MALPITIPRLGWNMEHGTFLGWLKQDGDPIRAGEMLFRLESEKAAEDIECLDAGVLRIAPKGPQEGDNVPVGVVIGYLVEAGEAFQEPEKNATDDKPFKVTLKSSGAVIDIPQGMSILEALRGAGHTVPSSCESGTCGSCKSKLVSGDVDHRDLVLTEQEKAAHIMVCVSRARAGDLVIDI